MRAYLVQTKDGTMFAAMASVKFREIEVPCGCGRPGCPTRGVCVGDPYVELISVGMKEGPMSALCDIKGWRAEIEALVLEQWKKASP